MADTAQAVVLAAHSALDVARGVSRLLLAEGMTPIVEFSLPNSRRLDVAALAADGALIGVEIKVSLNDLACDGKWPDYLPFCDLFYFAVPPDFPHEKLPVSTGVIVADRFGGAIVRDAVRTPIHPGRRRALTLRFAQTAAYRLARCLDPHCS